MGIHVLHSIALHCFELMPQMDVRSARTSDLRPRTMLDRIEHRYLDPRKMFDRIEHPILGQREMFDRIEHPIFVQN